MNRTIEILNNEHVVIANELEKVNRLFEDIIAGNKHISMLDKSIAFFRNYADKLHHYKEEEILFPKMVKKNELLGNGVIQEMLENHEDFRIMLGEIERDIQHDLPESAFEKFKNYAEALLDHIAVEDDEVFQIAESIFSEEELDQIYFQFLDCDRERA